MLGVERYHLTICFFCWWYRYQTYHILWRSLYFDNRSWYVWYYWYVDLVVILGLVESSFSIILVDLS